MGCGCGANTNSSDETIIIDSTHTKKSGEKPSTSSPNSFVNLNLRGDIVYPLKIRLGGCPVLSSLVVYKATQSVPSSVMECMRNDPKYIGYFS